MTRKHLHTIKILPNIIIYLLSAIMVLMYLALIITASTGRLLSNSAVQLLPLLSCVLFYIWYEIVTELEALASLSEEGFTPEFQRYQAVAFVRIVVLLVCGLAWAVTRVYLYQSGRHSCFPGLTCEHRRYSHDGAEAYDFYLRGRVGPTHLVTLTHLDSIPGIIMYVTSELGIQAVWYALRRTAPPSAGMLEFVGNLGTSVSPSVPTLPEHGEPELDSNAVRVSCDTGECVAIEMQEMRPDGMGSSHPDNSDTIAVPPIGSDHLSIVVGSE